ncbi:MAG TPA: zinc ribbon domain-containing protein [Quisquiliibacterium sp.]|nr:zinc ribbon domain-containing protein [Quisquiliibacterium sp.]
MPTYDYDCPGCGGFDEFRSLSRRNEPAACPQCGTDSPRVLVSAPRLSAMATGTRRAIEANERAAHEPKSSRDLAGSYGRLRHPAGCGCCSTGIRSATVRAPSGAKAFPTKRPWMISH